MIRFFMKSSTRPFESAKACLHYEAKWPWARSPVNGNRRTTSLRQRYHSHHSCGSTISALVYHSFLTCLTSVVVDGNVIASWWIDASALHRGFVSFVRITKQFKLVAVNLEFHYWMNFPNSVVRHVFATVVLFFRCMAYVPHRFPNNCN